MKSQIQQAAAELSGELVNWRRHLHANPELSFKEYNTSAWVADKLTEFGISFEKVVNTGIVGIIEGELSGEKCIALRGDMDALPIIETNDKEYASNNEGVMHACGHDVHTTCLLGAAKILNEMKGSFGGTIKLLFQPGEEKLPGGASLMIAEGVLENPTPANVFGQHVYPQLEVGKLGFRSGMYMASADEIYVTVNGKGGHAALPHQNIDPILIASNIVVSLQQLVSRRAKPDVPTVLSFGTIEGKGATNVIPDQVTLSGTFRTMNETWRAEAHQLMTQMAEGIAASMGGSCDFDIHVGYPFLVNDDAVTRTTIEHAVEYLGKEQVVDLDLRMTAEDFAYFTQAAPSCFYRLGVKNETPMGNLHTSTFDVDEKCLEVGAGFMAFNAWKQLT